MNSQEHNFTGSRDAYENEYLSELVHYTYFQIAEENPVTFLAMWSVALFTQTSRPVLDVRDYNWFEEVLTPPLDHFITGTEHLDWETGSVNSYRHFDVGTGYYNTFGYSELRFFLPDDKNRFEAEDSKGLFWHKYISGGCRCIYYVRDTIQLCS